MVSSFFENVSDTVFFPKVLFPQVFDGKAIIVGKLFSMVNDCITQGLGKVLCIVKDTNLLFVQKRGHPLSITKGWQGALNDYSVIARKNTSNMVGVSFC